MSRKTSRQLCKMCLVVVVVVVAVVVVVVVVKIKAIILSPKQATELKRDPYQRDGTVCRAFRISMFSGGNCRHSFPELRAMVYFTLLRLLMLLVLGADLRFRVGSLV